MIAVIDYGLGNLRSVGKALESSRGLFAKVVHGWEGFLAQGVEIPFNDENRDRVAETLEASIEIIKIARELAATRFEVEEKNSETSSPGTSEPVTSP